MDHVSSIGRAIWRVVVVAFEGYPIDAPLRISKLQMSLSVKLIKPRYWLITLKLCMHYIKLVFIDAAHPKKII